MIALLLVAAQLEVHVEIASGFFTDDLSATSLRREGRRTERRFFANGVLRLESGNGILLFDTAKAQITVASKASRTYARMTLAEFDATQFDADIPEADLRLFKLTAADHDNRCELTGPFRGMPVRIQVQTLPSSDDAKAMQAALNRLQLTARLDSFYLLARKYRALAPEAARCFDSPHLVNKRETVAGDAFARNTYSMNMTRFLEHDSLPAELFTIPADWTESPTDAKTLLESLLKI